jgi:hypothetical protein
LSQLRRVVGQESGQPGTPVSLANPKCSQRK